MILTAGPSTGQQGPPPGIPPEETPAIARIQALMDENFADTEAGVILTDENRITVKIKRGAESQAQAQMAQRGLSTGVVVEPVQRSRADLVTLTHQIAHDPDKPDTLSRVAPDVLTNTVELAFDASDSEAAGAGLISKYGADRVTVSPERVPRASRAGRYDDWAPYYAGDAIWRRGDAIDTDCTSGFGTFGRNSGNEYMLTAGHCWPGQAGSARIDTNFTVPRNMGLLTSNRLCQGCIDGATVSGNYAGRVWAASGASRGVVGIRTVREWQGHRSLVTTSGAATGEHRRLLVVQTDACVPFDDGITTCYLGVIRDFAVQGGDSGGPVYQYGSSGPNVFGVGTIVGSRLNGASYYNMIVDVINYFNVYLLTVPWQN